MPDLGWFHNKITPNIPTDQPIVIYIGPELMEDLSRPIDKNICFCPILEKKDLRTTETRSYIRYAASLGLKTIPKDTEGFLVWLETIIKTFPEKLIPNIKKIFVTGRALQGLYKQNSTVTTDKITVNSHIIPIKSARVQKYGKDFQLGKPTSHVNNALQVARHYLHTARACNLD